MTPEQEKIQEMLDKCLTGKYIFRGENNKDYGKISSGLYRQYWQGDGNNSANVSGPLIDNEHFSVSKVEADIVKKVKQHIRRDALNIEVLTELQHYGGKTALLDFSKDIHIALFFACDGYFDQDGRVIFFETSELVEKPDIDYEYMAGNQGQHIYTLISPTGKSPRVIFQSSIFIHVSKGYLEDGKYEIIEIEKDLKKPLLEYLSKYFNIETETIYNDIQGFIRNQHNYSTAEIEFYRGYENQQRGELDAAIKNYDRAIELNPQVTEAYNNRGRANFALGKYEEAIKDYDKAIELNPKYANYYDNRGFANSALGKHEAAVIDYNKAIELNPRHTLAYNNRGVAKSALGRHKDAIKDYNKAIEFNSQDAIAYCNRGAVTAALGNYEEAIEDCNQAKTLFAKVGNMKMVKKCEEIIAQFKNL